MSAREQQQASAETVGPAGPVEADSDLRTRIHRAWDAAHARACNFQSYDAGHISHIAAYFASGWVFKPTATRDDLEEVIKVLTWLFLAAGAIERLEAPDGR